MEIYKYFNINFYSKINELIHIELTYGSKLFLRRKVSVA